LFIETARILAQRRDIGRKGGKEALTRCTQRVLAEDSRRQARWADADDEGFSKQEWNPVQPMTHAQVDRVRVAKPFGVLAGFLASSAAARCFKARARGLLIGGLWAIGSGRAVEGAVEAAASDDKTTHFATFALPLPARPLPGLPASQESSPQQTPLARG